MLQSNFYVCNLTSKNPRGLRHIDPYRVFLKYFSQLHSTIVATVLTVGDIIASITGMIHNYKKRTSPLSYLENRLVTCLWTSSEDWPHLMYSGWYSSDLSLGVRFVPVFVAFHKGSDYWTVHPRLFLLRGGWVNGIDEDLDKICFIWKKVPLLVLMNHIPTLTECID